MSARSNCHYCYYDVSSKPEEKRKDSRKERSHECSSYRSRSDDCGRKYKKYSPKLCCREYSSNKHDDSSCSEKESKSDDSISCHSHESYRSHRSHRSHGSRKSHGSHRSHRSHKSDSNNKCEKYRVCDDDVSEKTCTKKIDDKCRNVIIITIRC